jgi:hypothetical protein
MDLPLILTVYDVGPMDVGEGMDFQHLAKD